MSRRSRTAQPASHPVRFDRLDALRGVAIVWMAAFHFCFDLDHFRFIRANFYSDPVWTMQRMCIVSLFLFCAGFGQAIAMRHRAPGQPLFTLSFWRRWAQVAGCALLVTIASRVMFPVSFITFGVLHGIAVALIVMRLSYSAGHWLWPLGLAAVLLPQFVQHPFFDTRWTNWIGLITVKPVTEDYVPIFPWLGVMWWGLAAGQWVLASRPAWVTAGLARPLSPLAVLGRWSLSFYMVHQPVLIGLVALAASLR